MNEGGDHDVSRKNTSTAVRPMEAGLLLTFEGGKEYVVSGLVGADGIYSTVRDAWLSSPSPSGEGQGNESGHVNKTKLPREDLLYLGMVVILGICPDRVHHNVHTELDTWTQEDLTFMSRSRLLAASGESLRRRKAQWVDGTTRVFSMPYDEYNVMWQLSFPMDINDIHIVSSSSNGKHTGDIIY